MRSDIAMRRVATDIAFNSICKDEITLSNMDGKYTPLGCISPNTVLLVSPNTIHHTEREGFLRRPNSPAEEGRDSVREQSREQRRAGGRRGFFVTSCRSFFPCPVPIVIREQTWKIEQYVDST